MRNKIWIATCILGALAAAIPSFGQATTTGVCHRSGKGFILLEVAPQALGVHLLHGDHLPYDIVIDGAPFC
jgi:hypothetical protein